MCENKKPGFVQIHSHDSSSTLDGCVHFNKLIARAKEYGHKALATTNHGNPSNLFAFSKECKKNGIKPILGLEFYITNDLTSRIANKGRELDDRDYHQSIFIKDKEGYKNFNYLTYISFTDGYYYKPRIDFDLLFSKKKGLMATTSCIASKINQLITGGREKDAEELFLQFRKHFGDDFYGEIQFNELNDKDKFGINQKSNNQIIIDLCNKYNVPIMIGGDVHYLDKSDAELQDVLINSKRQAKEGEAGFQIHARHLYYHDVSDYYDFNKKFGYNYGTDFLEDCFENSVKFSEKVNFEFETGKYHVPKIKIDTDPKIYIEEKTWEGLIKNIELERKYFPNSYSNDDIEKLENQVTYELKVINDLDLNDYMLMVYDIIKWCKENNIYVGPGRGSAGSSVVAWALGITGLNPLKHNLIFERFINPNRKVQADIDIDFMMGGRDKILEYLIKIYGREAVSNVVTYGTYGPKSALTDVSRGLNKDTGHDTILSKKITKLPEIDDATDLVEYFKIIKKSNTDIEINNWLASNEDTINFANKLIGQMKSIGTHAGGIVVTPGPIYDFLPVTRGNGNLVTAFSEADGSAKDLSELGILKLDILGLKTLNVLKECVDNIKEDIGIDLNEKIYHLDLTDKKMIDYFSTGNNYGIFQMDRSAIFTSQFRKDGGEVDSFNDIIAINAMNRPGPLEKFLPKYGYWKAIDQGKIELTKEELEIVDKERYPFEFMRKILSPTFGCMLYQENLMSLVCELTGMTFGESDSFRRAVAWKPDNPKYHTVKGYFDRLEQAMKDKGYTDQDKEYFLKYLRENSGYSFNIAHACTYSYISWQTLFFKVYYPSYFYSAMLNIEDKEDKIQEIIEDAKKNTIKILPLSISKSEYLCKAEGDDSIRLGYKLIRGCGDAVEEEIKQFEMHKCKNIDEVLQKPFKKINKTVLDNLIKLGCFDEFEIDRSMIETLKSLYKEPKIEKWFSRKRSPAEEKTMPEILSSNFDTSIVMGFIPQVIETENPQLNLINLLTPYLKINDTEDSDRKKIRLQKETIAAETELLGFSISEDDTFNDFARAMKSGGFTTITDLDEDDPRCYFKVAKITELKTKTGKIYYQYTLNDGRKEYKAKVWRYNEKIKETSLCVGIITLDQKWGYTLEQCEFVKI